MKILGIPFLLLTASIVAVGADAPAPGRTASGGLTREAEATLAQRHDGFLGALARENLAKARPKPPFDMTGTWFINLRHSFADFRFGPPYPEFHEPGLTALREAEAARAQNVPYRDVIGQCYPAGMPMIMTRVHPINMIQLPTAVYMLFGFTNRMRFIYTDGRDFTDHDTVVYTYNGESIGRFEGNALVVHTKYMEPENHYIDTGIPVSDQFEIVERITMEEGGEMLRIDYTLTDPKMWKGEWKSTKRWIRMDYSDIPESNCLPSQNENLPGTAAGQRALEGRARE